MTKLNRLIKKCIEQNNPNTGTAESFNNALTDLGRWVLSLYLNGKFKTEDLLEDVSHHENMILKDYINEIGVTATQNGFFKGRDRNFVEQLALCHSGLSKALEEYQKGFHPSYTYYRKDSEPLGIPSELAGVLNRILLICYHYEIDIDTIIIERYEYYKNKKCKFSKNLNYSWW